jgi:hypothetical protein
VAVARLIVTLAAALPVTLPKLRHIIQIVEPREVVVAAVFTFRLLTETTGPEAIAAPLRAGAAYVSAVALSVTPVPGIARAQAIDARTPAIGVDRQARGARAIPITPGTLTLLTELLVEGAARTGPPLSPVDVAVVPSTEPALTAIPRHLPGAADVLVTEEAFLIDAAEVLVAARALGPSHVSTLPVAAQPLATAIAPLVRTPVAIRTPIDPMLPLRIAPFTLQSLLVIAPVCHPGLPRACS